MKYQGHDRMQGNQPGWSVCVSVIVPCHNEEECIDEFYRRMRRVLDELDSTFEMIFVNDGSTDRTAEKLVAIQDLDEHVVLVDLSRNHGHQLALSAGLDVTQGKRVLLIDADLQDPPELLPMMMAHFASGRKPLQTGDRRIFLPASSLAVANGIAYRYWRFPPDERAGRRYFTTNAGAAQVSAGDGCVGRLQAGRGGLSSRFKVCGEDEIWHRQHGEPGHRRSHGIRFGATEVHVLFERRCQCCCGILSCLDGLCLSVSIRCSRMGKHHVRSTYVFCNQFVCPRTYWGICWPHLYSGKRQAIVYYSYGDAREMRSGKRDGRFAVQRNRESWRN